MIYIYQITLQVSSGLLAAMVTIGHHGFLLKLLHTDFILTMILLIRLTIIIVTRVSPSVALALY